MLDFFGDAVIPTLCVKNVPDDLYGALRRQAKQNHRSITAEFPELLKIHLAVHSDRSLHPGYRNVKRVQAQVPDD
jgi:hypothetical protein